MNGPLCRLLHIGVVNDRLFWLVELKQVSASSHWDTYELLKH